MTNKDIPARAGCDLLDELRLVRMMIESRLNGLNTDEDVIKEADILAAFFEFVETLAKLRPLKPQTPGITHGNHTQLQDGPADSV